jgi:anti-sigma regulatory factor (Ser/Thr protein kinase)
MSASTEAPDFSLPEAPLELRLDLPAVHSAARMARHLIRPFARSGGITGPELDNLVLVSSELLSNAVDHGGGESVMDMAELNHDVRMSLFLRVSGGNWELDVVDEGGGDPAALDAIIHPEGLPDLEDERGRGFFLISQMVDRITVNKSDSGEGIRLSVVRNLPAR